MCSWKYIVCTSFEGAKLRTYTTAATVVRYIFQRYFQRIFLKTFFEFNLLNHKIDCIFAKALNPSDQPPIPNR